MNDRKDRMKMAWTVIDERLAQLTLADFEVVYNTDGNWWQPSRGRATVPELARLPTAGEVVGSVTEADWYDAVEDGNGVIDCMIGDVATSQLNRLDPLWSENVAVLHRDRADTLEADNATAEAVTYSPKPTEADRRIHASVMPRLTLT